MESSFAVVNVSICFDCSQNGQILLVNYTETELEYDFIESLNEDNEILVVEAVDSIAVDVIPSFISTTEITLSTTEIVNDFQDQTTQTWIGSLQSLWMMIALVVILLMIIACLFYLLKKKSYDEFIRKFRLEYQKIHVILYVLNLFQVLDIYLA